MIKTKCQSDWVCNFLDQNNSRSNQLFNSLTVRSVATITTIAAKLWRGECNSAESDQNEQQQHLI